MRNEELNRLIKKFYDGETSEDDEKYLRALFSGDKTPAGYEAEKEIFLYFMESKAIKGAPPGLEERILKRIDESDRKSPVSRPGKPFLLYIGSAAAMFLLLTGTYLFLDSRSKYSDTFSDPEIAYAETMKILMDVSSRLNKGTSALAPVGRLNSITDMGFEKISESSALINKSLHQINSLSKALEKKVIRDTGVVNK